MTSGIARRAAGAHTEPAHDGTDRRASPSQPPRWTDRRPDLRIGWLQAFVAAAKHFSYAQAASELGSSPTRVKRNVESLEMWLHTVLINDSGPLQLFAYNGVRYGERFLPVASEVLRSVQALVKQPLARTTGESKLSEMWLSDLLSVAALRPSETDKRPTYKSAADNMGLSHDQLRKKVRKLERLLGHKLVTGYAEIHLSHEGHRTADTANEISAALNAHVAVIPDDYDPMANWSRRLRAHAIAQKAEQLLIVARVEKKTRFTKFDRLKLEAARKTLTAIDQIIEKSSVFAPPFTGRDIVIK